MFLGDDRPSVDRSRFDLIESQNPFFEQNNENVLLFDLLFDLLFFIFSMIYAKTLYHIEKIVKISQIKNQYHICM